MSARQANFRKKKTFDLDIWHDACSLETIYVMFDGQDHHGSRFKVSEEFRSF